MTLTCSHFTLSCYKMSVAYSHFDVKNLRLVHIWLHNFFTLCYLLFTYSHVLKLTSSFSHTFLFYSKHIPMYLLQISHVNTWYGSLFTICNFQFTFSHDIIFSFLWYNFWCSHFHMMCIFIYSHFLIISYLYILSCLNTF